VSNVQVLLKQMAQAYTRLTTNAWMIWKSSGWLMDTPADNVAPYLHLSPPSGGPTCLWLFLPIRPSGQAVGKLQTFLWAWVLPAALPHSRRILAPDSWQVSSTLPRANLQ